MASFPSGVTIVTAAGGDGRPYGMTCSSLCSVAMTPPTVLVCLQEEQNLSKSFRNLERVAVIGPSEVEVGAVVWARSLLVSEAALPLVQGKAQ